MTVSIGLADFSRRMNRIAKGTRKNSQSIVRGAVKAAAKAAIDHTPVKTAKAKANWYVTKGVASTKVIEPPVKGNSKASEIVSKVRTSVQIALWRIGNPPLVLSNTVPYAGILDGGSSAQAPSGMSAHAIGAARKFLFTAKVLKGISK